MVAIGSAVAGETVVNEPPPRGSTKAPSMKRPYSSSIDRMEVDSGAGA